MAETSDETTLPEVVWESDRVPARLCYMNGEAYFEMFTSDAMGCPCWRPAKIGILDLNAILGHLIAKLNAAERARDQFQALVNTDPATQ